MDGFVDTGHEVWRYASVWLDGREDRVRFGPEPDETIRVGHIDRCGNFLLFEKPLVPPPTVKIFKCHQRFFRNAKSCHTDQYDQDGQSGPALVQNGHGLPYHPPKLTHISTSTSSYRSVRGMDVLEYVSSCGE